MRASEFIKVIEDLRREHFYINKNSYPMGESPEEPEVYAQYIYLDETGIHIENEHNQSHSL